VADAIKSNATGKAGGLDGERLKDAHKPMSCDENNLG
jgi:hypothetical protein